MTAPTRAVALLSVLSEVELCRGLTLDPIDGTAIPKFSKTFTYTNFLGLDADSNSDGSKGEADSNDDKQKILVKSKEDVNVNSKDSDDVNDVNANSSTKDSEDVNDNVPVNTSAEIRDWIVDSDGVNRALQKLFPEEFEAGQSMGKLNDSLQSHDEDSNNLSFSSSNDEDSDIIISDSDKSTDSEAKRDAVKNLKKIQEELKHVQEDYQERNGGSEVESSSDTADPAGQPIIHIDRTKQLQEDIGEDFSNLKIGDKIQTNPDIVKATTGIVNSQDDLSGYPRYSSQMFSLPPEFNEGLPPDERLKYDLDHSKNSKFEKIFQEIRRWKMERDPEKQVNIKAESEVLNSRLKFKNNNNK
jgi:hypothetical protein